MKFVLILIVTIMVLPYFETGDAEEDMEEKEYEWAERHMNYLYTEGGLDYINGMLIVAHEFNPICAKARTQAKLSMKYRTDPDFGLYRIKIVNAKNPVLWNILQCPTAEEDLYVKRIAEGDTNEAFVLYKKAASAGAPSGQGPADGAGPSTV